MDTNQRLEDQEIWKCSFALACFIYTVTDRDAFGLEAELRNRIRKKMVKILSSIIEGFEAGKSLETERFLRAAVISLGDLKQILISAYQLDCLDFQEFSRAREQCRRLSGLLLAPGIEKRGVSAG